MSSSSSPLSKEDMERAKTECNKYVQSGLTRNMTIQFLMKRLVNMGCEPPKGFIRCDDCGDKVMAGGFGMVQEEIIATDGNNNQNQQRNHNNDDSKVTTSTRKAVEARARLPQNLRTEQDLEDQFQAQAEGKVKLRLLPEIFLCQQHLRSEVHAHECMVHELIHAIDMCRSKMDPINNCVHLACTEIRAENLSGECDWNHELSFMKKGFLKHGQECVKRRAAQSVEANPKCRDKAKEYVEAAFERCHKDVFPFDRHPNLR